MFHQELERLRAAFPELSADYSPPWGMPTVQDFEDLAVRCGGRFPASFVAFQARYAMFMPVPDNGFRWANPGLEPYLSLETTIADARHCGVPDHLLPFWTDEGNFCCFDLSRPAADGECPVVFWDHESPDGDAAPVAKDFVAWLREGLERFRKHRNQK